MEEEEFKKTIQQEELTQTDNGIKILFKSFLDCLLAGGHMRERCYIYSVARITGPMKAAIEGSEREQFEKVKQFEIAARIVEMVKLFNKIKEQGFWECKNEQNTDYDINGKEIDWKKQYGAITISKEVKIITKTRYYLDEKRDIKPFTRRIRI
jgi:hypothetical protein